MKNLEARRKYHRDYMSRKMGTDPVFKKKHLARVKRNDARYRRELNLVVQTFRSAGCLLCPEKTKCCLVAHHLDPATKDFEIGNATARKLSAARVREELLKCVCLCMNCHAKVHAGVAQLPS